MRGVSRLLSGPALLSGFVLLSAGRAEAEPYLAVREGLHCSACHVNRTGGGMRTPFGAGFGREALPTRARPDRVSAWDGTLVDGVLRLGGDLRVAYAADRGTGDEPFFGEYRVSRAGLYLAAELLRDRVTLYLDEQVAPGGATGRETFALLRAGRAGMYAKAGRFFLPYGLRLEDDDAATRRFTGFTFDTADSGIELGAEPGGFGVALAVTNGAGGGAEADNGKRYTARLYRTGRNWRAGVSASENDLPGNARNGTRGAFAAAKLGPLVALGEWDSITVRETGAGETRSTAAHAEIDWRLRGGVTLRAWTGTHDPDRQRSGDGTRQLGLGVDWTPLPGLQLRVWVRERDPERAAAGGADEGVVELHVYF